MKIFNLLFILFIATGCATFSYDNTRLSEEKTKTTYEGKATKIIHKTRGNPDVLIILSLAGGGSRAAYFSGLIMLELQKEGLLKEVDIITSVSGGSLPAAYYAISVDPEDPNRNNVPSGRIWDEKTVKNLMKKDYLSRWIGNWFYPTNIVRYWFTSYDRSDIMAQTFADNMYDVKNTGRDLKFKDINTERPYLIINSTDATNKENGPDPYSSYFSFTHEDFSNINSDIDEFDISRAVMASAAFPGIFNYVTLKNFSVKDKDAYVHVFDAGTRDNLGLFTVKEIINNKDNACKYKHIIVILVDSYEDPKGISEKKYDPRQVFGHFIDMNFFDAFDSLLSANREINIESLNKVINKERKCKINFWHIEFKDIEEICLSKNDERQKKECFQLSHDLRKKIPTNFKISEKDCQTMESAVNEIFRGKKARNNIDQIKEFLIEAK
jgi:NTE family protein